MTSLDDDDDDDDEAPFVHMEVVIIVQRRSPRTFSQYIHTLGSEDVQKYNVQESSLDFVASLCHFVSFDFDAAPPGMARRS